MFFNLAVSVRSTWAKAEMASVKSLLNPGVYGFKKAFLCEKSRDKRIVRCTIQAIQLLVLTKIC